MASSLPTPLADFMEAQARREKLDPPPSYGYKMGVELGVGFFREERTGCKVLEKPIIFPSGRPLHQGYVIVFAYCSEEGIESILSGQVPPMLFGTTKEPNAFESQAAIAENLGMLNGKDSVAKGTVSCCVAFRVPVEIATPVDAPGRDIWLIRFDQDTVSPFLQAVKEGDLAAARKYLDAGVSGAVVDEDSISALMIASFAGNVELCQAMLEKGAEVDYVEPTGQRTALMFAAQGGSTAVVELLISRGADTNKADSEGQTALMWAAVANKADTARRLTASCEVQSTNSEGKTALEVAVAMGHEATVAVLRA